MALGIFSSRMAIDAARPRRGAASATMTPTSSEVTIARVSSGFRHISTYQASVKVSAPAAIRRDREEERRHERQVDEEEDEADIDPDKATRSGASLGHRAAHRPPVEDLAEEAPHVEGEIPAREERHHRRDHHARHGGGEWIVEHVHGAGDGVAHQLIADAAHDDGHRALAEAADEAEDRRGENARQRQRQRDPEEGPESGSRQAPSLPGRGAGRCRRATSTSGRS